MRHAFFRSWRTGVLLAAALLASAPATWAAGMTTKVEIPEAVRNATGNKRIVLETWQAFHRGEVEAGLANMADDVTWLAPGTNQLSGLKVGKDAQRAFRGGMKQVFGDLVLTVRGLYGDGDTVVMEMSAKGHLVNGQPYANAGVTVWELEKGKIKHVREYADTLAAQALAGVQKREAGEK